MSAIYEHLSKKFTVLFFSALNDENQRYDYTELRFSESDGESFEQGKLYLLYGHNLTESAVLTNHNGFICIGKPSFPYTFCRCPLLVLKDDVSISEVHAAIITIFYHMQNYELTLYKLVEKNASLNEFLDVTYPFLDGNCITIADIDGRLLAGNYVEDELFSDTIRCSAPNNKDNAHQTPLPWISNNYDMLEKPMIPGTVYRGICRTNRYTYEVMIIAVFVNKKKYATIAISNSAHPLQVTYQLLLQALCYSIEKALTDRVVISSIKDVHRIRLLLQDILSGNSYSADYCNDKLRKNGIMPGTLFVCICVRPTNIDVQEILLTSIRSQIGEYIQNTYVLSKDDYIVLFINLKSIDELTELPKKLKLLFVQDLYKIGMSRTFYDFENAKYYYEQALIAINYKKGKTHYLTTFDHCAMEYILSAASATLPVTFLCHNGIRTLYVYDQKNQTEYIKTLYSYFSNHENAVKTASELFIHRSTLQYRINQIKEIMECNWDNYDEKLYIMLSLEMIKSENPN